jgi:putative endonuclease
MFYVYIIESLKDGTYYIGQTEDLSSRLDIHNKGLSKYTSRKLPWRIIYFEEYKTRKEAIVRERFLKEQRNREFYKKLINNWSGS